MANYLFTLTISPVQSFISQARKTKDLFAGSEILSQLMNFSIEQTKLLLDNYELILPDIETPSKANKIIIKITTSDSTKVKDFGKLLEALILNQFKSIANKTFDKNFKDLYKPKEFDGQIENLLQIFWVAVKVKDDYLKSYKQLEQNLGAVKNLRTFKQLEQISGRKCSVCGERNGLFYKYQEDVNQKPKKPSYIIKDALYLKKSNQIDDNETLCAVCFTKRFYSNNNYPSTAKIALLDWLEKVEDKEIYQSYFDGFDESLYFKENLSKEYLTKWGYLTSDNDVQNAIEFLDNLNIETKQKKHYALIQFDIDDMGKKLSELEKDGQKELSEALGDFALKAKAIVDADNVGKTVYAGGDDFLGFVNLASLFEVMQKIKDAFVVENLTYSMGIVIAHYKEPLHIVLNRVRSVEKMAKEIDKDKNGLGISVLKHSGETLEARLKNTKENIQNLTQIIKLVEDYFSDKFIINLELEFKGLIDKDDKLMIKKEMLEVELKRLIKKSLLDKEQNNKVDELFILLTPFIEHRKVSNFFSLLNIVRFMKRGLK